MIEGSVSGSIPLTNGSGCGSRSPKNIRIRRIRIRIRIRNTADLHDQKNVPVIMLWCFFYWWANNSLPADTIMYGTVGIYLHTKEFSAFLKRALASSVFPFSSKQNTNKNISLIPKFCIPGISRAWTSCLLDNALWNYLYFHALNASAADPEARK
jgi:hypothetical protein